MVAFVDYFCSVGPHRINHITLILFFSVIISRRPLKINSLNQGIVLYFRFLA